ncbi:MAG: ATP-binding protein [Pseudodesulfovibrio sp.]
MQRFRSIGIRCKLIVIFIFIKVLPLIVLAWVAWSGLDQLGRTVRGKVAALSGETREVIAEVGDLAVTNSIRALDLHSREAIERQTTDTAREVAAFLYSRDDDIRLAAALDPSAESYERFVRAQFRKVLKHKPWVLNEAGDAWVPADGTPGESAPVEARNPDNAKDFHYRPPDERGFLADRPVYLEMTFVDPDGNERIKVATSEALSPEKRNVADPANTYCRAETYFADLKKLKPGEIYVSEVIGPYLKSPVIGPYTQARAEEKGIAFRPEEAGYAGKENPVGRRFKGLIRWAAPVVRDGRTVGYVTLALDHIHVMEFTDHLVPTDERRSPIADAGSGNYAFMWDYKDRNISHPRDYFITGYDPETGQPAVPWMEEALYEDFAASGKSVAEWEADAPVMQDQSLRKRPSARLTSEGMLGLDCRYLNFAPQCEGWRNLTMHGGSGSFVIYWSGLWKLTTAAAIPYFTGRYGSTPRGFGFVTIGANVHEFHKAARETGMKITAMASRFQKNLAAQNEVTQRTLRQSLGHTIREIAWSTLVMIALVILVAIWMAGTLTRKITGMIGGIRRFQAGDMEHRLAVESGDEIGQLSRTFNGMAGSIRALVEDLRRTEENYRGFFENASEGIFRSTIDGRLVEANPAFARLFGYESPEVMLAEVSDIAGQLFADPKRREDLLHALRENGSARDFEYDIRRTDGTVRSVLSSCNMVRGKDGEVYLEGMETDITERRLKEQAEIEKEAALAASRAKSVFLANMSHEIRTPMNALLGMAEMLSETRLDEEQRRYVELFRTAGDSLLRLLNEILDFSRIEAGQMTMDKAPLDLRELASNVADIMSVQAENRGLTLVAGVDGDVPETVLGDRLRLKQVLLNLVGNAVKFTERGSVRVGLRVVEATPESAVVEFSVADTGVGIDKEKLAEIFESFTQADSSTTREYGGSGLGLTIARELVELMGGSIRVESTPGRGATFSFTIPFEISGERAEPVAEPALPAEGAPRRVLLVEDSESNRLLVQHYLKGTGHELIVAVNGEDGVNRYREDPSVDAVLMDVLMPVMDGLEATRRIRAYEAEAGLDPVPIVALTANAFKEDRDRCMEAGCTRYLSKPVRKADLLAVLALPVRSPGLG